MKSNLTLALATLAALGVQAPTHKPTQYRKDKASRTPTDVQSRVAKNEAKRARRAARSQS